MFDGVVCSTSSADTHNRSLYQLRLPRRECFVHTRWMLLFSGCSVLMYKTHENKCCMNDIPRDQVYLLYPHTLVAFSWFAYFLGRRDCGSLFARFFVFVATFDFVEAQTRTNNDCAIACRVRFAVVCGARYKNSVRVTSTCCIEKWCTNTFACVVSTCTPRHPPEMGWRRELGIL